MARGPTISTTFRAIDRATAPMQRMMRTVGRIATVGGAAIGGGLAVASRAFVDFDHSITTATAKFGSINLATESGRQSMEALRQVARDVGATTQFSAAQAADGLDYLAMAGFTARQAMATLPGVASLAVNANTDLARATDIASDALGAFGLMAADSAQLQANFTRINDVMTQTITSSNTSIEDLFESIKQGAATFTAAGQSLESFGALAGIMADQGTKGAQAGTILRNVMLRLSDPTAEAAKAMDLLGVSAVNDAGDFRDIIDILADFEKSLDGMGSAASTALLAQIFGARNVTGINELLGAGTESIREFRGELLGSAGAAEKMASSIGGSLANKIKTLQSTMLEKGFQAIEQFAGAASGGLDELTRRIREFDVAPMMERVGRAVSRVARAWDSGLIPSVLAGVAAFKILLPLLTTGAAVINAMRAAQIGLNVAFSSNPIGVVVTAVALLTAGIVALIQNWDRIKSRVDRWTRRGRARRQAARDRIVRTPRLQHAGAVPIMTSRSSRAENRRARIIGRNDATMRREITELRQTVDVNFAGLPEGTTVRERGRAPGVTINYGGYRPGYGAR